MVVATAKVYVRRPLMTLNELLAASYGIRANNLDLAHSHFGTEIYYAESDDGRYVVKTLPLTAPDLEKEGYLTEFLYENRIPVARFLKTKDGGYAVRTDSMQFHVQEFIEGDVLGVNTAPRWLMEGQARILGKIHAVLQNYDELDSSFGEGFFRKENAIQRKQHYIDRLEQVTNTGGTSLATSLEERIKHLERISAFQIDPEKLTYANSHGDFHIGQIIVKGERITVIDWTSACKLPISLEVAMSYVFAAPECKCGKISGDGLKRYIEHYSRHFDLNDYDIEAMPRLLYYQQIMCHYPPPYDDVPGTYKPICRLINAFTGWLYQNTEMLERELPK